MPVFIYITQEYKFNNNIVKPYEIGIVEKIKDDTLEIQFVDCEDTLEVPRSIVRYFDPQKTGDQYSHKVCNRCNRLLPTNMFRRNQNGINNRVVRRPSCNDCRELIDGKDMPPAVKSSWTKNKPNMIIWECPICKKRTIPGLTSKVVLDHNHKTGMPNAWICDSCNTGLGRFKDDIEVMQEAIEYLKKYQS